MSRLFAPLCVGLAGLVGSAAHAQAATIGFEAPPALVFAGDTYTESGIVFTQLGDFASIDTAAGFFLATPPTGNDTSFYSVLNDGAVRLTSQPGLFTLSGFDAGFVGPLPVDPGTTSGFLLMFGIDALGNAVDRSFDLGPAGADGSFAFKTFSDPADFAGLGLLASVTFQACVLDGQLCFNPADNLAQFSIDNIQVVAVPEPETYALVAIGWGALVALRRRKSAIRVGGAQA